MYQVYKHEAPNGKVYIGITKDIKNRWSKGRGYRGNRYFWRAIQKYGWDNFKHEILFENITQEEACEKEIELIAYYNSTNPEYGYNICNGGEINSGFTFNHTEEAKRKISEANKGKIISEEQRKQISESEKGKVVSIETRQKLSEISSNMPDRQKQEISETVKKRWENGDYSNRKSTSHQSWNKGLTMEIDNRIVSTKGKKRSMETRTKISESHKGIPAHNRKKVLCMETNMVYDSCSEASQLTGINNISRCANDQKYTAGGYHWKYIEEVI